MKMTMGASESMEEGLHMAMKMEMSIEMKMILGILLGVIKSLKACQYVDIKTLKHINSQLAQNRNKISRKELTGLAKIFVKKSGVNAAERFKQSIQAVAKFVPDLDDLRDFADDIGKVIKKHASRKLENQRKRGGVSSALRALLFGRYNIQPRFDQSADGILKLIKAIPQCVDGKPLWALAGGWAVEFLTGEKRDHQNLDVLVIEKNPFPISSSNTRADDYFGVISSTDKFITNNCLQEIKFNGQFVITLKPEYLFLSKFLKSPREKDSQDLRSLVKAFGKTWNLKLMSKIIDKNNCGFKWKAELLGILNSPDPDEILKKLSEFWDKGDKRTFFSNEAIVGRALLKGSSNYTFHVNQSSFNERTDYSGLSGKEKFRKAYEDLSPKAKRSQLFWDKIQGKIPEAW